MKIIFANDSRVPVSKHEKVVSLDIQECQDDILPTILEHEPDPSHEAIFIDCIGAIDQREAYIIPQCLESGDGEVACCKER